MSWCFAGESILCLTVSAAVMMSLAKAPWFASSTLLVKLDHLDAFVFGGHRAVSVGAKGPAFRSAPPLGNEQQVRSCMRYVSGLNSFFATISCSMGTGWTGLQFGDRNDNRTSWWLFLPRVLWWRVYAVCWKGASGCISKNVSIWWT